LKCSPGEGGSLWMQAPHIKILPTKAKLHVLYYVGIKNLKYYVVNFIAFTI